MGLDGIVKFAAIVNATGLPQKLRAIEASDRRLIGFATEVLETQRFKPATMNGSPATAEVEFTVGLHTCALREKHSTDENFYQFTLRTHPLIALTVAAPPLAPEIAPAARSEAVPAEQVGGRIAIRGALSRTTDPFASMLDRLPKNPEPGHASPDSNGVGGEVGRVLVGQGVGRHEDEEPLEARRHDGA